MTPCRLVDWYQCFRGTRAVCSSKTMVLTYSVVTLKTSTYLLSSFVKLKASEYKFIYKICTGGHKTIFNTTITRRNQFFIYLMFLNKLQVLQNIKGAQKIKTGQQVMIWNVLMFYPNVCLDRLRETMKKYRGGRKGMKK
jgi:hypothetical protein